jgi:hypothetical protein
MRDESYTSKLVNWENYASVRNRPIRLLIDSETTEKLYFPPESVPALRHPLVLQGGEEKAREILLQRLYIYLCFTARLEHGAVNPTLELIAGRRSGFALPDGMIEDAYKIYTDEAWHAQFSDGMLRQLRTTTSADPYGLPEPAFMSHLALATRDLAPPDRNLACLFFTIVSETLISSILLDLPRDERLITAVRELVADHALDEGKHHAYFSSLLPLIWMELSASRKVTMGCLVPGFIRAFLDPDTPALIHALGSCGFTACQAAQIVHESLDPHEVAAGARQAARRTIRLCREVGLTTLPPVQEAFHGHGLVESES